MGYTMQQGNTKFRIKKKNFKPALAAINEAEVDGQSWEDTKFTDVLGELEWEPTVKKGDIVGIDFHGEKLTSVEEDLFNALAPFVEKGSYIEAFGEDMAYWRWYFDGKTVVEQTPKHIEWE